MFMVKTESIKFNLQDVLKLKQSSVLKLSFASSKENIPVQRQ